jgi:NitT/TauT family transport system substrate-binding protein
VAGILSAEPGNPQQDGIVVPPGSEMDSADDLSGATVGINSLGGNTQVAANTAIEAAGGDASSVKYVQLPPDTLVNAATSGKVDAVVTFGNFYATALQAGFTPVSKGALDLPDAPSVVWAASTKYIAEKPDVAKAFVGAIEKANDYANTHPAEVRSVDTELTKLPAAFIKTRKIAKFTTAIDLEGTQALSDAMKDQGFTKSAPAAEDLVWADAPTS